MSSHLRTYPESSENGDQKMDIEFECHRRGVRPRLGFEAKRLGNGKAAGDYLGAEGLAAFVSGYYPTTHGEAGMIAYVQERSVDSWATKLCSELTRHEKAHSLIGGWVPHERCTGQSTYSSTHQLTGSAKLLVTHVLLPFLAEK